MTSLESLETRYFNRILLLLVGLWPYRRSLLITFHLIIFFGVLITYIMFQFTIFLTPSTPDIVLKVLSSTFFFIFLAIKYNSFLINNNILRDLLKRLQNICDELKDKNEIAIINKYRYKGKRYVIGIILLVAFSAFVLILSQMWLYIYQTFIYSVNKSLHSPEPFVTEYFIDQEKYYYLIKLHQYAAYCVGAVMLLATGSYLIMYMQYTCGMFIIASYRIKQALMTDISQRNILKDKKQICKEIIHAVDIHRKAIECSKFLISSLQSSFFFLIGVGVITLTLNLLRVVTNTEIQQLLLSFVILTILYVYLFLANYIAQQVTDHNEYLFLTVYNVQWYMAPIQIQKLILFLLQKGTKSFHLIVGGMYVACMETAASVTSASITYFTVIYTVIYVAK